MNLKDDKRIVNQIRYLKSNVLFGSVIYYIMQNRNIPKDACGARGYFRNVNSIDDVVERYNKFHHEVSNHDSFLKEAFLWDTTSRHYRFWEHINSVMCKL